MEKNEVKSTLERTNKSFPSLNISLMQEYENLLHEDFLKGKSPFEYLIDALQMDNLMGIEGSFNNTWRSINTPYIGWMKV